MPPFLLFEDTMNGYARTKLDEALDEAEAGADPG